MVTAADGTTIETYNIVLTRVASEIEGKVITQNYEGKHKAIVTAYRTSDTRKIGDANNPREAIYQVETNDDGTYLLEVPNGDKYDIIVEKEGYLTYELTDIPVPGQDKITLKDINIYAGNLVESYDSTSAGAGNNSSSGTGSNTTKPVEEIELDDLVALNDNYGITITDANKAQKAIYDLNEDGVVDKKDRNILKANYNKKAEPVKCTSENVVGGASLKGVSITSSNTTLDNKANKTATASGVANKNISTTDSSVLITNGKTKVVNSDGTISSGKNNGLILPTTSKYKVTSEYGERVHPVTGVKKRHTGIDLGVEHHSEVISVADGEVTFAGVQNGFGNCVEVKHVVKGVTIYSFYAHLSRIDVKAGDKVVQGQVVGLEGGATTDPNPGSSTGHHLHFEIRKASGYLNDVNPNDYFEF